MKKIILALLVAVIVMGASLYSAKAKKTSSKNNYKKVYHFSVQGDCTNEDADVVMNSGDDSNEHTLFRKIAVPSIKIGNMPKMALFQKYAPYSGYSGEMWQPIFSTSYYLTDGYLWIRYGGYESDNPSEGCSESHDLGEFRLFIY